jgi:hypothetical protein
MDREEKGTMGSPVRRFSGEAVLVVADGELSMVGDGERDKHGARTMTANPGA